MTYSFRTTATMKEYNNKKWWIDAGIIREIIIDAENLKTALQEYKEIVNDQYYVSISDNALKNKNPMYRGDKQTGYVITGKTDFQDDTNYKWSAQYIDLWVNISIIVDAFPD